MPSLTAYIGLLDIGKPKPSEILEQMEKWIENGKIKTREFNLQDLENTPQTLNAILKGDNFGKTLIIVDDEIKTA